LLLLHVSGSTLSICNYLKLKLIYFSHVKGDIVVVAVALVVHEMHVLNKLVVGQTVSPLVISMMYVFTLDTSKMEEKTNAFF